MKHHGKQSSYQHDMEYMMECNIDKIYMMTHGKLATNGRFHWIEKKEVQAKKPDHFDDREYCKKQACTTTSLQK